jgi:RND family efflux transporter MFP subunit
MFSKILVRTFIVLLVLAAVAWGALFLLRPVAVTQAAWRGTAPKAVSGTLSVRAERTALLVAEIGGRIKESRLELGQTVAAGDVLIEIDSATLQVDIKQTQADMEATRKRLEIGSARLFELKTAEEDLVTKKRLLERGSVSRLEIERHERGIAQLKQAIDLERLATEEQLEKLENGLETRKIQLSRMTIRSPIDGVVSEVFAYPDDLIGGGSPIARIISVQRVVEAKISEENFSDIAVGQHATVRFTGYGGTIFNATVAKVLPAADPQTQRYTVHLQVEVDPARLVAGLTGESLITVAEHSNAVIIPRTALAGNRVYVANGGRVQVREVSPGFQSLTHVEIAEGVQEGDLVVVEELDRFRDGQRVRVREIERAGSGAGAGAK